MGLIKIPNILTSSIIKLQSINHRIHSQDFKNKLNDTVNSTEIGEIPITNENWKLFVSLIALSTFFLLFAVTIYILLRDKQNLHGWIQFSYLFSFLLFNLVFFVALFPGLVQGSEINTGCFLLSVSNQFFFICSKAWLLVIGLDILWNLWKIEIAFKNDKNFDKLLKYSILGWIFPAIIVACGVSLNLAYQHELRNKPFDPGLWTSIPDYGHLHCRLPNWRIWEIFVFLNCLAHFVIFALIIFLILKHRFEARNAIQSIRMKATSRNNQMFLILIKLFFVVGLSWSYIAIQDLLQAGNINTKQNWGWDIFRIIFFLQGVFISLVYVCNKKTIRLLQDKYPRFQNLMKNLDEKFGFPLCPQCKVWRRESFTNLQISLMKSKLWNAKSQHSHSIDTRISADQIGIFGIGNISHQCHHI